MAYRLKPRESDVAKVIDQMLILNGARVWPIKEPFCPHCRRFTGDKAQAGIPDRFVLVPHHIREMSSRALWLELKRPGGVVRDAQAEFIKVAGLSVACLVASSWEEVRDFIENVMAIELKVRG